MRLRFVQDTVVLSKGLVKKGEVWDIPQEEATLFLKNKVAVEVKADAGAEIEKAQQDLNDAAARRKKILKMAASAALLAVFLVLWTFILMNLRK